MHRGSVVAVVGLLAAVSLSGCDGGSAAGQSAAPALPAAFDDGVPEPTGEVVLTLDVDGRDVAWDMATLEALDQHEITVFEPFLEADSSFSGPLWRDVLAASGVSPDTEIDLLALDDYTIRLTTDPALIGDTLLATSELGAPIPVEDGGPIRLIFVDGDELGENLNNWIWQLRSGSTVPMATSS